MVVFSCYGIHLYVVYISNAMLAKIAIIDIYVIYLLPLS